MPTFQPPHDVAVRRPSGERVTSSERGAILPRRAPVMAPVLAVVLSGAMASLGPAQPLSRASAIPLRDREVRAWSADPNTERALKSGDPGATGRIPSGDLARGRPLQPAGASATRPNSATVPS